MAKKSVSTAHEFQCAYFQRVPYVEPNETRFVFEVDGRAVIAFAARSLRRAQRPRTTKALADTYVSVGGPINDRAGLQLQANVGCDRSRTLR